MVFANNLFALLCMPVEVTAGRVSDEGAALEWHGRSGGCVIFPVVPRASRDRPESNPKVASEIFILKPARRVFLISHHEVARLLLSLGLKTKCLRAKCTCQHSCHERIVTGTVYKRDVAVKHHRRLAVLTGNHVRLGRPKGLEALGRFTSGALVQFRVGVAQFDCDITEHFAEVAHRVCFRNSANQG